MYVRDMITITLTCDGKEHLSVKKKKQMRQKSLSQHQMQIIFNMNLHLYKLNRKHSDMQRIN